MTRAEILKPSVGSKTSLGSLESMTSSSLDQEDSRLTPDLHFPLHFSRVDKQASASLSEEASPDVSHVNMNTPPPFDLQLVGGGGRDFLTPLFQMHQTTPADAEGDSAKPESGGVYNGTGLQTFQYSGGLGDSGQINLMVGDELVEPFASAIGPHCIEAPTSMQAHGLPASLRPALKPLMATDAGPITKTEPICPEEAVLISAGPSTEKFRATYPDLDEDAVHLFDYFRDRQSIMMSVSPLNYFRSVFLAFSLRYRAIMCGVLAWAAWHQGNQEDAARKYFDEGSALIRQESLNSRSKEEILAALLVLASAKICSGDTSDWRPYLILAGETIHVHGGLTSFMESESVRWLLKNFAYHEILTSSSLNLPKLFSANDFEIIFNQPSSASLPDTLCACCQPVFVVLERINELARAVRLLLQDRCSNGSDVPQSLTIADLNDKGPNEDEIHQIYSTAHELERKIWTLQPAHKILQHLSERNLSLQLALFDVFRLVAVLHLYQSVLRINSASLSARVVARRLHKSIDPLFGTMVEGILIFPLFILGIATTTKASRQYIISRFDGMVERLNARNVTQAQALVQKVWDLDYDGLKLVDWNELVDSEGLHFCFA